MKGNFLNLVKIINNHLEHIIIILGMLLLYFNYYLYFCTILSIVYTKLLLYFYSNFDRLNIDFTFSYKKPADSEKISEYSKGENTSEMERSIIFSDEEDRKKFE
jgi:hypothetical protein